MAKGFSGSDNTEPHLYRMPSRQDVFLGGIFLILVLGVLRFCSELFVPFAAAMVLTFVFQPAQRLMTGYRIPPYLSARLIVAILVGGAVSLGSALSGPASEWAARVPESLPELQSKFKFLSQPVEKTKRLVSQAEEMARGPGPKVTPVAVQGSRLFDKILNLVGSAFGGLLSMLLMLFFLLAAGDIFVRRAVEILPNFRNKRQAVDIVRQIEGDMSRYLMTISFMNMVVGTLAGIIMWFHNIKDPMLWGLLAFLLNYLPVMGPVMGVLIFLVVGFMEIQDFWQAIVPAALFLGIHLTESNLVTPRLLARQFTINPLIVILALVFWYWMWGLPGALLSVPMLMITKIICSHINRLKPVGHLLEG
jgi:predicted PurR-regulated permease PerM